MSKYRFWTALDRFWLHVPMGFVLVFLAWLSPVLCGVLAYLFLAYEKDEDKWLKDEAFKDVQGAIAGIIAGGIIWAILRNLL